MPQLATFLGAAPCSSRIPIFAEECANRGLGGDEFFTQRRDAFDQSRRRIRGRGVLKRAGGLA